MAALDVVTNALKEMERVSGIEPPSKAWELDQGAFQIKGLEIKHLREKRILVTDASHWLPMPTLSCVPFCPKQSLRSHRVTYRASMLA